MKPPVRHSILRRIVVLHALATLLTAALVTGSAFYLFETIGDHLQRQVLDSYANTLAGSLRGTSGRWKLAPHTSRVLLGGGSSFSFSIVTPQGRQEIPLLPANPAASVPLKANRAYFRLVRHKTLYSGVSLPFPGHPDTWIVVAQNLDHPTVIFDDLRTRAAMIGAGIVLLLVIALLLADAVIVRRSLASITRAARDVQQVSPDRLQQRVETHDTPEEIVPLLDAFNAALERVETAYRIERDFVADAAHELRTPLAILRLLVEQSGAACERPSLLAQIDVVETTVNRLLLVAEIDAMRIDPDAFVDLYEVAQDRLSAIAPLLITAGHSVELVGNGPVLARIEAHAVQRALDSLLENAARHTPSGSRVRICVTPDCQIRVEDDGPGIAQDGARDGAEIFRRFATARRDIARSAGLGLAITRELMEKAGGHVEARKSSLGGACFVLHFQPV